MRWYIKVLKQYADFSGRARRKEFWMFVLFNLIFAILAIIIDNAIGATIKDTGYGAFYLVYVASVFIPALAVMVRRLHDRGKSGWMMLIALIPIVGVIWLFVLLMQNGKPEENIFGNNPKESDEYAFDKWKNVAVAMIIGASFCIISVLTETLERGFTHWTSYIWTIQMLFFAKSVVVLLAGCSLYNKREGAKTAIYFIIASILWIIPIFMGFFMGYRNLYALLNIIFPIAILIMGISMLQKKEIQKYISILLLAGAAIWLFQFVLTNVRILKWDEWRDFNFLFVLNQYKIILPISFILLACRFLRRENIKESYVENRKEGFIQPEKRAVLQQITSHSTDTTFTNDTIASLIKMKCPRCGGADFKVIGNKGAAARSILIGGAFGAIGSMVAGRSAAKDMETKPVNYKCTNCKHTYSDVPSDAPEEEILSVQCIISFERVSNFVGAAIPQVVYLNGIKIGTIKNGKKITFPTFVKKNIIFVTDQFGNAFPGHYTFEAQPNTSILVRFNRKFK